MEGAPGVRTVPRQTLVAFVIASALYVLLANAAFSAGGSVFGSMILAGVFIATGNLWYTIGLHALANEPIPLVETSPDVAAIVTLGVGLMVAVVWWLVRARCRRDPQRSQELPTSRGAS